MLCEMTADEIYEATVYGKYAALGLIFNGITYFLCHGSGSDSHTGRTAKACFVGFHGDAADNLTMQLATVDHNGVVDVDRVYSWT